MEETKDISKESTESFPEDIRAEEAVKAPFGGLGAVVIFHTVK